MRLLSYLVILVKPTVSIRCLFHPLLILRDGVEIDHIFVLEYL